MSRVKIYDCPGESVLSYAVFTLYSVAFRVDTKHHPHCVNTYSVLNIKPIWYGLSANSKATWYNLNIVLNIWYKTRGHQCLMFRKPVGKSSPLHYEFVLIKIITIMNLYSGNSIQFSNALLKKSHNGLPHRFLRRQSMLSTTSFSKIIIINKIISIMIILIIMLLRGVSSDI